MIKSFKEKRNTIQSQMRDLISQIKGKRKDHNNKRSATAEYADLKQQVDALEKKFETTSVGINKEKEMVKNYVMPGEAARILGVCDRTLRYWEEQGKITAIRTAGGQRRYDITTYTTGTTGNRVIILYARVSSTKQKEDLQRQCECATRSYYEPLENRGV